MILTGNNKISTVMLNWNNVVDIHVYELQTGFIIGASFVNFSHCLNWVICTLLAYSTGTYEESVSLFLQYVETNTIFSLSTGGYHLASWTQVDRRIDAAEWVWELFIQHPGTGQCKANVCD